MVEHRGYIKGTIFEYICFIWNRLSLPLNTHSTHTKKKEAMVDTQLCVYECDFLMYDVPWKTNKKILLNLTLTGICNSSLQACDKHNEMLQYLSLLVNRRLHCNIARLKLFISITEISFCKEYYFLSYTCPTSDYRIISC